MSRTLLIVSDLVSRQQIKAVLNHDSIYIKDVAQLNQELELGNFTKIVLDLTSLKIPLIETLQAITAHKQSDNTICFFPHVQSDLASIAENSGFSEIFPRSKFFPYISELLND